MSRDLLQEGDAFLEAQRHENLAHDVEYCPAKKPARAAQTFLVIRATIGRTIFNVERASGIVEQVESRDFLVRAQDLLFGRATGETVKPAAGDRIIEQDAAGERRIYEVNSPGEEPVFQVSDAAGSTLRIHTKFVGIDEQ